MKKSNVRDGDSAAKNIRVVLFILAGLYAMRVVLNLEEFLAYPLDLWVETLFIITFVVCGLTIVKMPIGSIVIPLALLTFWYVLLAFVNPVFLLAGLAFKLATYLSLAVSLVLVIRAKLLKKQNQFLADE